MSIPVSDQTVIEIRRDVPIPPNYSRDPASMRIQENSPVDILLDGSKSIRANRANVKRANEAFDARVAVHDGAPDAVYAANVELRDAEQAERDGRVAVLDALEAELPRLQEEELAARVALAERYLPVLDEIEIELAKAAIRGRALALAKRGKSIGAPIRSSSTRERIAGGESLHNLREGLRALLPQEPTRYVSPVAYAELRRGEDTTDINGEPLPFTVAEELKSRGKLRVNHGKPLARGADLP